MSQQHKMRSEQGLFILFAAVFLVVSYFIDADYITYVSHFIRKKYIKNSFQNKTIWVIGASSGIGEYLVYELAKENAQRVIISSRREEELERVKKASNALNSKCEVVIRPLDALKSANEATANVNHEIVQRLFQDYDDIDIIVLNLGSSQRGLAMDTELSLYSAIFEVMLIHITLDYK
ncbi:dehydrogenase/reductase SDR family member 7 [Reticulomyxa filosa]|uniref:Dehydrogenase/reductase SDR family member 7 n=1 Tax=Reticulomyxa filosa TaxID=46433 RepID=X6NNQ0_RETFI|nr:dehydrogenase/reductase SDR family member 7 [Reticulomyxa filosa]|eukprot:ETO27002.1 dehydrogenase/reductase SDR family member 7 [Reticulomyxa filosa]